MMDQEAEADRRPASGYGCARARLEQQHAGARVFGKPGSQRGSGRARADDDVVILLHGVSPSRSEVLLLSIFAPARRRSVARDTPVVPGKVIGRPLSERTAR